MPHIQKPKPRRERLRVDDVTADARFQVRQFPGGALVSEDYVAELLDLLDGGADLEPLEVVRVDRGKKQPLFLMFDGFHRHEAHRRKGSASVEVLVYDGTEADALLWCLSSNARHGLKRTPAECRAAFDRLVSSAVLLERAIAERQKYGGTERALAAVCGLSHGAVAKYLTARGLRVDRANGKLCALDGPRSPERDARRELVAEATNEGKSARALARDLGVSEKTVAADRAANRAARAGEKPKTSKAKPEADAPAGVPLVESALDRMQRALQTALAEFETIARSKLAGRLQARARTNGVPVEVVRGEVPVTEPGAPAHATDARYTHHWPALEALAATVGELRADLYTMPEDDE